LLLLGSMQFVIISRRVNDELPHLLWFELSHPFLLDLLLHHVGQVGRVVGATVG